MRAQLALTQAELVQAKKDRAAMQVSLDSAEKDRLRLGAAIDKLNATGKQQAITATAQRSASSGEAEANAADAQHAANDARLAAELADSKAVLAVIAARSQADELMKVSDHNNFATYATLITSVFGFLTLLAGFFWKAFTDARDHRWVMENSVAADTATALHRSKELQKIAEVQTSAQAAYSEANTVNKKIESIGLKMADNQPLRPPA
jgi:hypothetical protein